MGECLFDAFFVHHDTLYRLDRNHCPILIKGHGGRAYIAAYIEQICGPDLPSLGNGELVSGFY